MEAEWTPASYSLTLDELLAQASPHRFLYNQYLRQLRKAEGGLSGMNTAQAGDLIENLSQ
jgi:hypothetical protein